MTHNDFIKLRILHDTHTNSQSCEMCSWTTEQIEKAKTKLEAQQKSE